MKKLAIITTHPIQYYAPVFKILSQNHNLSIKVHYTWGEVSINKFDPGFNKNIQWDLPLLEGYEFEWVKNTSKNPGTHNFNGIINPELKKSVNSWNPDAILIYGWGFISHLKIIRYYKNRVPIYFRGDSTTIDQQPKLKSILRKIILSWIYKNIDLAFYVGTNNKNYYLKYGLTEKQLIFAPHSVDNDRFGLERPLEVLSLKKSLQIDENEIIILFAGKFEGKKSPFDLLNAFISLNNKNIHLLFVGNGGLEKEMKEISSGKKNIHFLDFQNQSYMPVIYQTCDIFCLPSIGPNETWGLAINEAMACGKSILASNKVGGAIDLIFPGLNGEIFEAGSSSDLEKKLHLLISANKEGLKKMGEKSKQIIDSWNFKIQAKIIADSINKNDE